MQSFSGNCFTKLDILWNLFAKRRCMCSRCDRLIMYNENLTEISLGFILSEFCVRESRGKYRRIETRHNFSHFDISRSLAVGGK